MHHRHRDRSAAMIVAAGLIIALALIANPELRPFLLLTDTLGLDLIALLLATQLRHFAYALLPAANPTISALCALAFRLGSGAMRTYPKVLPWQPFDKLFCPALVFITYGTRCGVAS